MFNNRCRWYGAHYRPKIYKERRERRKFSLYFALNYSTKICGLWTLGLINTILLLSCSLSMFNGKLRWYDALYQPKITERRERRHFLLYFTLNYSIKIWGLWILGLISTIFVHQRFLWMFCDRSRWYGTLYRPRIKKGEKRGEKSLFYFAHSQSESEVY